MGNLLSTRREIHDILMTLPSLDDKQRKKIEALFETQLDFGGVSEEEYNRFLEELYENRSEYSLSDTDYQELKKLKERLKKGE